MLIVVHNFQEIFSLGCASLYDILWRGNQKYVMSNTALKYYAAQSKNPMESMDNLVLREKGFKVYSASRNPISHS